MLAELEDETDDEGDHTMGLVLVEGYSSDEDDSNGMVTTTTAWSEATRCYALWCVKARRWQ